jgi:peptidoglycan/LPS O-acetylase OafA/YrhL
LQAFLTEYRDRNFIYFLFYFILGGIAGVSLMKWREFVERAAGWNSCIFVNLYILIGYELMKNAPWGGVNLNYSTSFKPSMFFYTVSAIILLYGLSVVIAKYRSLIFQSLEQIGRLSYGIYLAHALVLVYAVRTADLLLPSGQALWLSVLAFVFCMLGSWGIVFLISLVPGSGIVIGPHRKKAPR